MQAKTGVLCFFVTTFVTLLPFGFGKEKNKASLKMHILFSFLSVSGVFCVGTSFVREPILQLIMTLEDTLLKLDRSLRFSEFLMLCSISSPYTSCARDCRQTATKCQEGSLTSVTSKNWYQT